MLKSSMLNPPRGWRWSVTKQGSAIYIDGSTSGLDKTVAQFLRIVVADAPPDVRVAALSGITEIHKRPVNISNCVITTRIGNAKAKKR